MSLPYVFCKIVLFDCFDISRWSSRWSNKKKKSSIKFFIYPCVCILSSWSLSRLLFRKRYVLYFSRMSSIFFCSKGVVHEKDCKKWPTIKSRNQISCWSSLGWHLIKSSITVQRNRSHTNHLTWSGFLRLAGYWINAMSCLKFIPETRWCHFTVSSEISRFSSAFMNSPGISISRLNFIKSNASPPHDAKHSFSLFCQYTFSC